MNSGKKFENDWKKSIKNIEQIYYYRLKDSPSGFGQDSKFTRFTNNNPYDCYGFYNFHLFPMELKHTKNGSISIQRYKTDKNKMIKLHQIEGLTEASHYKGIWAGFVFNFINEEKDINHTYWLSIIDFNQFLKENAKKSINEKDTIIYNGILINAEKKRVNYIYNVLELLNSLIEKERSVDG